MFGGSEAAGEKAELLGAADGTGYGWLAARRGEQRGQKRRKEDRGLRERGESSGREKRTKLVGGCGALKNCFPRETQPAQSKNKLF